MGRTLTEEVKRRFAPRRMLVLAAPFRPAARSEAFSAEVATRWESAAEAMRVHLLGLAAMPAPAPEPAVEARRKPERAFLPGTARAAPGAASAASPPPAAAGGGLPEAQELAAAVRGADLAPGHPAVERGGRAPGALAALLEASDLDSASADLPVAGGASSPEADPSGSGAEPARGARWSDTELTEPARPRRAFRLGLGRGDLARGALPPRPGDAKSPFGVDALIQRLEERPSRRRGAAAGEGLPRSRRSSVIAAAAAGGGVEAEGPAAGEELQAIARRAGPGDRDAADGMRDHDALLRRLARLREWKETGF